MPRCHLGLSGGLFPHRDSVVQSTLKRPVTHTTPHAHLCDDCCCKSQKNQYFLLFTGRAHCKRPFSSQDSRAHLLYYNFCIIVSKSWTKQHTKIFILTYSFKLSPWLLGSVYLGRSSWQWEHVGRGCSPHGGQTEKKEESSGALPFGGILSVTYFLQKGLTS